MTINHTDYLFVYGTLRRSFGAPVLEKIKDNIEWLGIAEIKGKLFDIGGYPAALPVKKNEKSVIRGEIIKILNSDSVWKVLDNYEGYDLESVLTSEYYRNQQPITLADGQMINAWVYWYNFPVKGKKRIRCKDYLHYLKIKKTV